MSDPSHLSKQNIFSGCRKSSSDVSPVFCFAVRIVIFLIAYIYIYIYIYMYIIVYHRRVVCNNIYLHTHHINQLN